MPGDGYHPELDEDEEDFIIPDERDDDFDEDFAFDVDEDAEDQDEDFE